MKPESIPHFKQQARFSIEALAERLARFHQGLELFTEWRKDTGQ